MTYDKFKKIAVDEKKFTDKKNLIKYLINLALFLTTYGIAVGIAVFYVLNYRFLLLILVLACLGFVWTLDLAAENESYFKKIGIMSKLWWTGILVIVAILAVLLKLHFI